MLRLLLRAAAMLALVYAGLCLLVLVLQAQLMYHPTRQITATPAALMLAFDDVALETSDGVKLHGWYVPAAGARATVLFCHGNAGNISGRLGTIRVLHGLGLNVLLFDYRGYGRSAGSPSEEGTYRDAEAAWRYLVDTRGVAPGALVIHGRSLGGAVAADLAMRHPPAALILESTFTKVADHWIGRALAPAVWLSSFRYDAAARVRDLGCPKLVVHSREDRLVPFALGRRLFEAAAEPKEFLEISGTHNEGFLTSGTVYTEGLDDFLRRHLEAAGP